MPIAGALVVRNSDGTMGWEAGLAETTMVLMSDSVTVSPNAAIVRMLSNS